jgi:hypothetical protein
MYTEGQWNCEQDFYLCNALVIILSVRNGLYYIAPDIHEINAQMTLFLEHPSYAL